MSQSFLDAEGNINVDRLSKELGAALEFDTRYHQTDNMKKRAVKTAASYDEFKAMVACAHLKKLSKKEVESLSNVKKGWKKPPTASTLQSAGLLDLENEAEKNHVKQEEFNKKVKGKKSSPTTSMELERELRRLPADQEKLRLLVAMGAEPVIALLDKSADVDLIEQILHLIVAPIVESTDPDMSSQTTDWLRSISGLQRFDLMLRFADRSLLSKVSAFLETAHSADEALKMKYSIQK